MKATKKEEEKKQEQKKKKKRRRSRRRRKVKEDTEKTRGTYMCKLIHTRMNQKALKATHSSLEQRLYVFSIVTHSTTNKSNVLFKKNKYNT